MTETFPKIQMCISCVFRVVFMRTMLIALLMGGAAHAGAWEEFEARCLVPMENVEAFDSSGLKSKGPYSGGNVVFWETTEYWTPSKDLFVVQTAPKRNDRLMSCEIIPVDPSGFKAVELRTKFLTWSHAQEAAGKYNEFTERSVVTANSTKWRDPEMRVRLKSKRGLWHLVAEEILR